MELPSLQDVKRVMEQVELGHDLSCNEAMSLVQLIYSLMTPDHTWWRPPPIPHGQIMLLANDQSITPPMVFQSPDEAALFGKMNQTQLYLPIPKPPCLDDEIRKTAANN